MSIAPVPGFGSPPASSVAVEAGQWEVQPGDTLCEIARALQRQGVAGTVSGLVCELARLNQLADPDRIDVGQVLRLPPRGLPPVPAPADRLERSAPGSGARPAPLRADERRTLLESALLRLRGARTDTPGIPPPVGEPPARPKAANGTPLFRQGDPTWRTERLGMDADGPTLARAGCAVTACAMALSRLNGQTVTPDTLVRRLRERGGFQGALVDWSQAGPAAGGGTEALPAAFDPTTVDRELDAGRPVLLRVEHELLGSRQQHWICLTGRDAAGRTYSANDPATGRTTALVADGSGLVAASGEPVRYASDGRMVTFRRAG